MCTGERGRCGQDAGKYEFQTEEGRGRFEVRNARVSVSGKVLKELEYKAEADLCDEGKIKMLDAYARLKPVTGLSFTIGQMRVPFRTVQRFGAYGAERLLDKQHELCGKSTVYIAARV